MTTENLSNDETRQSVEVDVQCLVRYSRRYVCDHCGNKGRVSKNQRGKKVKCPICKQSTKGKTMTETYKLELIKQGAQNIMAGGSIIGGKAGELYFQRDDFGGDPRDPKWFNEGFPFRIWKDSGIGYALGRGRPEYSIDGQSKTVTDAIEAAGSDGVIVLANH